MTNTHQVNAKIGKYLGLDVWNTPTQKGGTIQMATDFAMLQPLNTTDGDGPIGELYPSIAAVAANLGDPNGKYASFLAKADPNYPAEAYFLFAQPFSDSGLAAATPTPTSTAGGRTPTGSSSSSGAGAVHMPDNRFWGCLLAGIFVVFSFLI